MSIRNIQVLHNILLKLHNRIYAHFRYMHRIFSHRTTACRSAHFSVEIVARVLAQKLWFTSSSVGNRRAFLQSVHLHYITLAKVLVYAVVEQILVRFIWIRKYGKHCYHFVPCLVLEYQDGRHRSTQSNNRRIFDSKLYRNVNYRISEKTW